MSSMTGSMKALQSAQSPVEEVGAKCFCAGFAFLLQVCAWCLIPQTGCFAMAS